MPAVDQHRGMYLELGLPPASPACTGATPQAAGSVARAANVWDWSNQGTY